MLGLKRQDVLESIVDEDPSDAVRFAAITRISDQKTLARFACRDDAVGLAAMKQLTDRNLISDVGLRSHSRAVREMAVEVIDDPVLLHRIAHSDTDPRLRLKARKKHAGRHAALQVIERELSRLHVTPFQPGNAAEVVGTRDEIGRALVSDDRFRINGSIEITLPGQAAIRESGHGAAAIPAAGCEVTWLAPVARFLAMKRTGSPGPEDEAAADAFYEIIVWRTAEDTFRGTIQEKRREMVLNPVMWSSVSNGATFGSALKKALGGAPGASSFKTRVAGPVGNGDASIAVEASNPAR